MREGSAPCFGPVTSPYARLGPRSSAACRRNSIAFWRPWCCSSCQAGIGWR